MDVAAAAIVSRSAFVRFCVWSLQHNVEGSRLFKVINVEPATEN